MPAPTVALMDEQPDNAGTRVVSTIMAIGILIADRRLAGIDG